MALTREKLAVVKEFYDQHDSRTLGMIIQQLLCKGFDYYSNLSEKEIEKHYQAQLAEEVELAKQNKVKIISADFEKYLHTSCKELASLDAECRSYIIKNSII